MSNQFGKAGKSTRDAGNRKYNTDIVIGFIAFVIVTIIALVVINNKLFRISGTGVLILVCITVGVQIFLPRFFKGREKTQNQYYRGAKGEEQVGELLAQLSSDFVVMHDVVSPHGNIDHIVYDKRGNIFLVETKSHGGRVSPAGNQLLLNGHDFEKNIVNQCVANAIWMREKIEAELKVKARITPVLVFTNAFVEFGKPIKGVYYTNKKYLLQFLQRSNASSTAGLKLWEMKGKEEPKVEQGR